MFIKISTESLLLRTNSWQNSRWQMFNLRSLQGNKALEKCDSGRIRDTGHWAIKITVCRIKEQKRWMGQIWHIRR